MPGLKSDYYHESIQTNPPLFHKILLYTKMPCVKHGLKEWRDTFADVNIYTMGHCSSERAARKTARGQLAESSA